MLLCNGIFKVSSSLQCSWVLSKYSIHCPDTWILSRNGNKWDIYIYFMHTLIASVKIAVITLSNPLNTWLPGSDGLYSQIALAFLTTAILVMHFITSMFARLMTCPMHLDQYNNFKKKQMNKTHGSCSSLVSHFGSPHCTWIFSMVWQVVVLLLVLSKVAV